jgi:Ca2+-binding EF-hand superfamily protein
MINKRTKDNLAYQKELEAEHAKHVQELKDAKEAKASPKKEKKEPEGSYRRINGINYDRAMLDEADKAVAGVHDGRISIEDAKKILKEVLADGKYSEVEKRTMRYIRQHYVFTEKADAWLRRKVAQFVANKNFGHAPNTKVTKAHKEAVNKVSAGGAGRKKVPSLIAAELEVAGSWYDAEDKEAKVSETKFKQQLRETFRKFDANHNNKLEKEELADMLRAMGRRPLQTKIDSIFETLDEDGDGSIDFAEFLRYFKEHHAPLKRSKSGVTSEDVKAEVEKVVTERKKEKAAEVVSKKRKAVDDEKDQKTHTLADAAADSLMSGGELDTSKFAHSERLFEQQLRKIFSSFDSNHNNVITKGELKAALTKLGKKPKQAKVDAIFETLDTDGDGKIDFDEFSKYFKPSDAEDEEPQPAKKKAKH